jgi:hypothetical protein
MRYRISNHSPNQYTAQPVGSTIKKRKWHPTDKMKFKHEICEYERRDEDRAKKKQLPQCNISTNQCNILQDDILEEYNMRNLGH